MKYWPQTVPWKAFFCLTFFLRAAFIRSLEVYWRMGSNPRWSRNRRKATAKPSRRIVQTTLNTFGARDF